MHAFEVGLLDVFEKLAKAKFKSRSMAEHVREYGDLPRRVVESMTPGQKTKVEKIVRKRERREAGRSVKLNPDKLTPSQIVRQQRLARSQGAATAVSRPIKRTSPLSGIKTPASMMSHSSTPGTDAAIGHVFRSSGMSKAADMAGFRRSLSKKSPEELVAMARRVRARMVSKTPSASVFPKHSPQYPVYATIKQALR